LFITFGNVLVDGSARFQEWAKSSDSVGQFAGWVETELPNVMYMLGQLAELAGHLVQGFAPLGSVTVTGLGLLAQALNAIPINVLQQLVPLVTASVLAFKGFSAASEAAKSLGAFSVKLKGLGPEASVLGGAVGIASTALRGMGLASLVAGPAIGVLVGWLGRQRQAQAEARAEIDNYTQALVASKGVIDANVKSLIAKQLSDDGAFEAAQRLGIAQKTLVDTLLGSSLGLQIVNDKTKQAALSIAQYGGDTSKMTDEARATDAAIGKVNGTLADQSDKLATAKREAADQAAALGTVVQAQLALGYSTDTATQKMQEENDAANLLKGALDALNGKTLDAADAQNAFDSALANMGDHVSATGKKIRFTTTSLHDMSSASVALRGQLNSQVHDLENVIEANGGLANSTSKSRQQMMLMRQQIIDNAVAHGVDRKAVTDYIDSILRIPKSVPPTKLDIDKAAAQKKIDDFKALLKSLTNKTVTVSANTANAYASIESLVKNINGTIAYVQVKGVGGAGPSGGHALLPASGGYITGPGTGTSDSIPARLSNGEFVVNANATKAALPMLHALNRGIPAFAAGGLVGDSRWRGAGDTIINIHVNGQVYGSTRELAAVVLGGLKDLDNSGTPVRFKSP